MDLHQWRFPHCHASGVNPRPAQITNPLIVQSWEIVLDGTRRPMNGNKSDTAFYHGLASLDPGILQGSFSSRITVQNKDVGPLRDFLHPQATH
jgi:hypothetical protein